MYFQVLDEKKRCFGIYENGKVHFSDFPKNLSKTWSYYPNMEHLQNSEFACIYAGDSDLGAACPAKYKKDWTVASNKMKAFATSFEEAQISLDEHCFYDLIPISFLFEYFEIRDRITKHVLETGTKPKNYDLQKEILILTREIATQELNLDLDYILHNYKRESLKSLSSKIKDRRTTISYEMFKTATGRLSTSPDSFPILNLPKCDRSVVTPTNNYFLEIDFSAADPTTFLALAGVPLPDIDIHSWNRDNVFKDDSLTRDELKQRLFSWLYNPLKQDAALEKIYEREKLKDKFWNGKKIVNPLGREVLADEYHSVSYLVQSTSSDLFLDRVCAVSDFLKDRESHVAFMIHDSVIIDLAEKDLDIVQDLIKMMKSTKLGTFMVNVSFGGDFGNLKPLGGLK